MSCEGKDIKAMSLEELQGARDFHKRRALFPEESGGLGYDQRLEEFDLSGLLDMVIDDRIEADLERRLLFGPNSFNSSV